jgi:acyl-ACP thioesterase
MATISSYPFTIQPENVDFTLRASVASIISYMLNVAGADAHHKGFGVEALQGHSFTWVLSRLAVDINTQPRQYSNIEIDTWVNEFNRLSSTRNFKMRIGEDVIAAGVSQWCMLNMETRQAVDMTQLKDIYERAMVAEPSPITAPARLRDIEPQASVSRPVVYSDIDFNRHVNTLRYIDLIFDSLPIELIEKNNGMRLDINFIAEALYGEVLTIGWTSEGNVWQFEISSDSGKKLCRAKIEFK